MRFQFISLLLARGLASAIQAVVVVLLARWAGAENFGLVSTITGVGAVLFVLADWGLTSYIPMARARGLNSEVNLGLRLQMLASSGAAVVGTAAIWLWLSGSDNVWWFCLLPVATCLEQMTEARLAIAVADGAKKIVVVSILLRRFASLTVFIALFWLGLGGLESYALCMLVASVTGVFHVVGSRTERRTTTRSRGSLLAFYGKLTPYLLANISSQARSLDVGIVTATSSVSNAGLYSAAFRFTSPLMLVAASAASVLLPHSSKQTAKGAKQLSARVVWGAIIASAPLALAAIYSETIIVTIFGDEYISAVGAFVWALVVIPFMSLDWAISSILQGQGKQNFVAKNALLFAPLILTAVAIGAVTLGPSGAAAGMAISYMVKVVPSLMRVRTL